MLHTGVRHRRAAAPEGHPRTQRCAAHLGIADDGRGRLHRTHRGLLAEHGGVFRGLVRSRSATEHHQRHRVAVHRIVGGDFECEFRQFGFEDHQEPERCKLTLEGHRAPHRTNAVLIPAELRQRERQMVGGVAVFRRECGGTFERAARLMQTAQGAEGDPHADPGAGIPGVSLGDAPKAFETLGVTTQLPHDPGGVEASRQFHAHRSAYALKRLQRLCGAMLQRLDDPENEMCAAHVTIARDRLLDREARVDQLTTLQKHGGSRHLRYRIVGLHTCGFGIRCRSRSPLRSEHARFGDRGVHLTGGFTAIERDLEFDQRLIEVAGVAVGDAEVEMRAALAIGHGPRHGLHRPRIEGEVHVHTREIRIELQRPLCGGLRLLEQPHVAEHEGQQMLRPRRRLVERQGMLQRTPGGLRLAPSIQNFPGERMHRDVVRRQTERPIEPGGGPVGIAERLLNEGDFAQGGEVVGGTVEQLAEHRGRIGGATEPRMPFAQRECQAGVVRTLAQRVGEPRDALGIDGGAGGQLLQVLRGERHAGIDVECPLEALRRFVREAAPGEHHATVVLRPGIGDRHATRDRTQPVCVADRQHGHGQRGHRHQQAPTTAIRRG